MTTFYPISTLAILACKLSLIAGLYILPGGRISVGYENAKYVKNATITNGGVTVDYSTAGVL